jgi:hypothetical protein
LLPRLVSVDREHSLVCQSRAATLWRVTQMDRSGPRLCSALSLHGSCSPGRVADLAGAVEIIMIVARSAQTPPYESSSCPFSNSILDGPMTTQIEPMDFSSILRSVCSRREG